MFQIETFEKIEHACTDDKNSQKIKNRMELPQSDKDMYKKLTINIKCNSEIFLSLSPILGIR